MSAESGATAGANGGANGDQDSGSKNVVAKEDHDRALSDLQRFKKQAQDVQKERDDFKARLEALEKQKTESSGDFKSLYEAQLEAYNELKGKNEALKGSMILSEKYKTASSALAKAGIAPEALKILDKEDFKDMEVEFTTQGRMLVHGAETFVDRFKKEYPFAFPTGKAPQINTGGGSSGAADAAELTASSLYELEKKCKAKGDMTEYNAAIQKYIEQKKTKARLAASQ